MVNVSEAFDGRLIGPWITLEGSRQRPDGFSCLVDLNLRLQNPGPP